MRAEARDIPIATFDIPTSPQAAEFDLLTEIDEARKKYGDLFATEYGGTRAIVLTHPHDIEELLVQHNDKTKKPAAYDIIRDTIGNGLITLDGDEWKRDRKLVNRFFIPAQVRSMIDNIISVKGHNFASSLRERTKQAGGEFIINDLRKEELEPLIYDTIRAALLGKHATSSVLDFTSEHLSNFFDVARQAQGERTPQTQDAVMRTSAMLGQRALALVDVARAQEPDTSLLSILAHTKDEATDEYIDDKILRNEIATLVLAGQDATTLGLTWLFTFLRDQPEVVNRVRQEIARESGGHELTAKVQGELTYTRQVVNETLRLRPSAPIVGREALRGFTIGAATIEPGNLLLPSFWSAHRHEDFWGSEPELFDPDRFSAENIKKRQPEAFRPFAVGPRHCIGMNFALAMLVGYTAAIVRGGVELETFPEKVPHSLNLTLTPAVTVGVHVKLRPLS